MPSPERWHKITRPSFSTCQSTYWVERWLCWQNECWHWWWKPKNTCLRFLWWQARWFWRSFAWLLRTSWKGKKIDVYIFKHIIFLPDQLGLSAELKSKLDGTIEKYIVYISKYLSSSHANVLMLFFKDMSTNEFAIDFFQFKNV